MHFASRFCYILQTQQIDCKMKATKALRSVVSKGIEKFNQKIPVRIFLSFFLWKNDGYWLAAMMMLSVWKLLCVQES